MSNVRKDCPCVPPSLHILLSIFFLFFLYVQELGEGDKHRGKLLSQNWRAHQFQYWGYFIPISARTYNEDVTVYFTIYKKKNRGGH